MIKKLYDFERGGEKIEVWSLTNAAGMEMVVSTCGARLISLTAPDRNGKFIDVLCGYKTAEDCIDKPHNYNGAFIGRFANRIGQSRFTVGGKEYRVTPNEKGNCLHGGKHGFDEKVMKAEVCGDELALSFHSPDGDEGFPGNLDVTIRYALTDAGEVVMKYDAVTDKPTVVNFTNHAYFNLGESDTILDHVLDVKGKKITVNDDDLIPHGEFADVEGTPFSFLGGEKLGKNMFSKDHMIALCHGYDCNYVIDRRTKNELETCATVYDPASGRYMEVLTTLPGVQLYTSNTLKGYVGKKAYENHAALCLETQDFPNAPNCPTYPSTQLLPGERYHSETVYKFSVK